MDKEKKPANFHGMFAGGKSLALSRLSAIGKQKSKSMTKLPEFINKFQKHTNFIVQKNVLAKKTSGTQNTQYFRKLRNRYGAEFQNRVFHNPVKDKPGGTSWNGMDMILPANEAPRQSTQQVVQSSNKIRTTQSFTSGQVIPRMEEDILFNPAKKRAASTPAKPKKPVIQPNQRLFSRVVEIGQESGSGGETVGGRKTDTSTESEGSKERSFPWSTQSHEPSVSPRSQESQRSSPEKPVSHSQNNDVVQREIEIEKPVKPAARPVSGPVPPKEEVKQPVEPKPSIPSSRLQMAADETIRRIPATPASPVESEPPAKISNVEQPVRVPETPKRIQAMRVDKSASPPVSKQASKPVSRHVSEPVTKPKKTVTVSQPIRRMPAEPVSPAEKRPVVESVSPADEAAMPVVKPLTETPSHLDRTAGKPAAVEIQREISEPVGKPDRQPAGKQSKPVETSGTLPKKQPDVSRNVVMRKTEDTKDLHPDTQAKKETPVSDIEKPLVKPHPLTGEKMVSRDSNQDVIQREVEASHSSSAPEMVAKSHAQPSTVKPTGKAPDKVEKAAPREPVSTRLQPGSPTNQGLVKENAKKISEKMPKITSNRNSLSPKTRQNIAFSRLRVLPVVVQRQPDAGLEKKLFHKPTAEDKTVQSDVTGNDKTSSPVIFRMISQQKKTVPALTGKTQVLKNTIKKLPKKPSKKALPAQMKPVEEKLPVVKASAKTAPSSGMQEQVPAFEMSKGSASGDSGMLVEKQVLQKSEMPVVKTPQSTQSQPQSVPVGQTHELTRSTSFTREAVIQREVADDDDDSGTGEEKQPKVDLDKVAQQIYPMIMRKLAIEKERANGRRR